MSGLQAGQGRVLEDKVGEKIEDKILFVYSSQRSMLQAMPHERVLPKAMMMGEFFEHLCVVRDLKALPQAMRAPLVMSVLKECESELERVRFVFEKSFLGFLESSGFLFGFFDELSHARVAIEEIPLLDTYGEYEDHLRVLGWLKARYEERLGELGFYDGLMLPKGASVEMNEEFLRAFKEVRLYVEGVISPAHQELLAKAAAIVPLAVHFWLDDYNIKLPFLPQHILESKKPHFAYSVDYKSGEVLGSVPLAPLSEKKISAYSFSLGISQAALVFAKIDEWVKSGVREEEIVIILPNEDFMRVLALFDKAHNLNFAMGKDIRQSAAYKELERLLEIVKTSRFSESSQDVAPLAQKISYTQAAQWLENALVGFEDKDSKKLRQKMSETLYMWDNLGLAPSEGSEILALVLESLGGVSVDDVSGGKIRVMGVLESRGFCFEKAIIVDFNEGVIPSVGESDLFLNSSLRQRLQMPTMNDKERLQKHYYYGIFAHANEVALAYVENEDSHPSLMLEELELFGAKIARLNGERLFALLPQGGVGDYQQDCFKGVMPKALSPSKLKVFLECPRQFFYRYVECLGEVNEDSSAASMGNIAHACLEAVYAPYVGKRVVLDSEILFNAASAWLDAYMGEQGGRQRVEIELLKCELEQFFKLEHGESVEILCLEAKAGNLGGKKVEDVKAGGEKVECEGFSFQVRPDRIQRREGGIEIIDYKYRNNFTKNFEGKNSPAKHDYALVLYKLAAQKLGLDSGLDSSGARLPITMAYWSIKEGKKLVVEDREEELREILSGLGGEVEFTIGEKAPCSYCAFRELCDR